MTLRPGQRVRYQLRGGEVQEGTIARVERGQRAGDRFGTPVAQLDMRTDYWVAIVLLTDARVLVGSELVLE